MQIFGEVIAEKNGNKQKETGVGPLNKIIS